VQKVVITWWNYYRIWRKKVTITLGKRCLRDTETFRFYCTEHYLCTVILRNVSTNWDF